MVKIRDLLKIIPPVKSFYHGKIITFYDIMLHCRLHDYNNEEFVKAKLKLMEKEGQLKLIKDNQALIGVKLSSCLVN